jgi:microcystin degradation protein MlrC
MADPPTVFVAGFEHETNTFVPTPTTREDFEHRYDHRGPAVADAMGGTETAIGGIVDAVADRGFEATCSVAAAATPGGRVDADCYDHYVDRIVADLGAAVEAGGVDGVALALHGAMVPEGGDDGEGPLLAAVRRVVGPDVPVVATLDLHGNVSRAMVDRADALVAFETFPHLDKADTGATAVDLLAATMAGDVTPTTALARPPMVAHVPKQHTGSDPMAAVEAAAREAEEREGVLKVNVLPGFYHADVPEMGVTVPVVTDDDPDLAASVAAEVATSVWVRREAFVGSYPDPPAAVREAAELAAATGPDEGPVVVGDFGPNPGAGGSSDGTTVLRELRSQGVPDAGYALLYDPESVAAAIEAGVGNRVTLDLGGKVDDRHGEPIRGVDAYVRAVTDGVYENTGTSHSGRGVENRVGRVVDVRCGPGDGVRVLLSERRHSAFDAEVWRQAGIQPERLDVLAVPSFVAFLGDYGRIGSHVVLCDSPGLSAVDPARFDYERIPRPLFPLDDVPAYEPDPVHRRRSGG